MDPWDLYIYLLLVFLQYVYFATVFNEMLD